ncbi:MAG TPA: galactose oxidase-like domain-containing protein, partial [Planctomycetota bacterium]|nr:galactose oxidase-like domain-containing protein [Planctomycetota bacterium]
YLPDGRVLAFGGTYTGTDPSSLTLKSAGQVADCTNVADLWDPATNAWRPVAPAGRWSHYHAVTVVAPDGRVISSGGAGAGNGTNFGDDTSVEAYEPPYLFRGVRPRIDALSTTDLSPGETFTMQVSRTSAVTRVLLLSARAASHWIDLGPQRFLPLAYSQTGSEVTASVPGSAVTALPGWYLLFVLVDDIPSAARIVRVTASAAPAAMPGRPVVTVTAADASAGESAANSAAFVVSRTGGTSTPLTVQYALGGSSTTGTDFASPPGFVVIPGGSASATVTITPTDDALVEGSESVTFTLTPLAHYAVGSPASASATIDDNDAAPGDTDADGLPDPWEQAYFGNLLQTGSGDPDGDGLSNAGEASAGSNPVQPDSDGDGMPDGWEVGFGLDPADAADASQDADLDGAANAQEYAAGTDPTSAASSPPAGGGGGGGSSCGATGVELVLLGLVWLGRGKSSIALRTRR